MSEIVAHAAVNSAAGTEDEFSIFVAAICSGYLVLAAPLTQS
jgi:hypothetical protein